MTGRGQIAVVRHVPLCRRNGSSITKNCPKSSRAFWLSGCGIYAVKAADAPGVSVRTGYSRQERWNADGLVPGYAGGYPSKFTAELKPELFEKVREKDRRTIVEARHQPHFSVATVRVSRRRLTCGLGTPAHGITKTR